jgi:hypothetical protein
MDRERRFIEDDTRVLLQQKILQLLTVLKVCRFNDTLHFNAVNVLEPRAFMLKERI